MYKQIPELKGLIIKNVEGMSKYSEEVFITAINDKGEKRKFKMFHNQDCCEKVYLEDVNGDVNDLLNNKIIIAEEVINKDKHPLNEWDESYTWTFYKIGTSKGVVTLRWYGSSNGYYSESVGFEEVSTD